MYLLRYRAKPKPDHAQVGEIGGAYINCWMDLDSMEAAKAQAMDTINEEGWTVDSLDVAEVVLRSTCDEKNGTYFDQALIDKTVLVFHTWPIDAPDGGEEDETP